MLQAEASGIHKIRSEIDDETAVISKHEGEMQMIQLVATLRKVRVRVGGN